jgi:hypothetical protein
MAIATTQLARVIHCDSASTWQLEGTVERQPLSMSWVVVTDSDGSRKLHIEWTPSADLH